MLLGVGFGRLKVSNYIPAASGVFSAGCPILSPFSNRGWAPATAKLMPDARRLTTTPWDKPLSIIPEPLPLRCKLQLLRYRPGLASGV